MYIRLISDALNLLAPKEIKLVFDENSLRLSVKIKEIYLANDRNPPLQEDEYFMDYECHFDDLLSRPEACHDDSWLFPLPSVGITNTSNPPPLEYHSGMFGPDPTKPFDFGKPVVGRLAIRPTSLSFEHGAIMGLIGAPGCLLSITGAQEFGPVPPIKI
jgi:hypothetical protein